MNDRILCTSHAKINWWLKVGAPRPDGYHELETVFQELELAETISFRKTSSDELTLSGFPADIQPEKNLVTRSWQLMKDTFPRKVGGVDVTITKTLPRGGGLGGGSSNAACTIAAINSLFNLEADTETLQALAGQIGSDVAFFINGGTGLGTGRGEIIKQLPPAPKYWLVLVMPEEPMSTAQAYKQLDSLPCQDRKSREEPHTLSEFLTSLNSAKPEILAQKIINDFELVAEGFSWYKSTRDKLDRAGVIRSFLCGSGSTVAGIVTDKAAGQKIANDVGGILTSTR